MGINFSSFEEDGATFAKFNRSFVPAIRCTRSACAFGIYSAATSILTDQGVVVVDQVNPLGL